MFTGTNVGVHIGNAAALTNVAVTVRVYTNGIAIGPYGQINTAGTTTCGIQEAINSLTNFVNGVMCGGKIELGFGVFPFAGQIRIPSRHPITLTIKGTGEASTILRYRGTTNMLQVGAEQGVPTLYNNLPNVNLNLENFGMAYEYDTNLTYLVDLGGNINQARIEGCMFTTWNALVYTNHGANPSIIPPYVTNAIGTVGLRTSGTLSLNTLVRKCNFMGLAGGIGVSTDHAAIEDCFFSVIGHWTDNGVPVSGTAWNAANTPADMIGWTNIWAQGVAIAVNDPAFDVNIVNPYFYECENSFFVYGPNTVMGTVRVVNPFYEFTTRRCLIGISAAGIDSGRITFLNMGLSGNPGADLFLKIEDGTTKTFAQQFTDESQFVSAMVDLDIGDVDLGFLLKVSLFNDQSFMVDSGQMFGDDAVLHGNGAGITNLQASSLTFPLTTFTNNTAALTASTATTKAGKLKLAAGTATYTVTHASVTTAAAIQATINTVDVTATLVRAVPANGSFTLVCGAAPTGNIDISWEILSP